MVKFGRDSASTKVVAAIPCFNTEKSIADIISRAQKYVDKVIVVDDGSSDNTAKIAKAVGALVVSHSGNRGYGEAIKSCFLAAQVNDADLLVIIDGDGQHNPDDIPRLLAPIIRKEADLVVGSRFIKHEHNMPIYRKIGIGIITFLWNFNSRVKVSDTQSGFRAYSKKTFETLKLQEKGMSISIEIIEKARGRRDVIQEVPVSCSYFSSPFNLNAVKHGLMVALSTLRIRLKNLMTLSAH